MLKTRYAAITIASFVVLAFLPIRPVLPSVVRAAGPSHVDLTWMSIANVYFELGPSRIMADG